MSQKVSTIIIRIIGIVVPVLWTFLLRYTDSYFCVYAIVSLVCILLHVFCKIRINTKVNITTLIFSIILSSMVTLANSAVYLREGLLSHKLSLVFIFLTGICVFYLLLMFLNTHFELIGNKLFLEKKGSYKIVFLYTFLAILFVDITYLFLANYPGGISGDSVSQLEQIVSGKYTNHHPYWHTMLIKVWYVFGNNLFHSPTAGVLCYSIFQVVCMALIFAYSNQTLCQLGARKIVCILIALFSALVPYNIHFSYTMWKDVLFGGTVLLFLVSFLRIFENIGRKWLNWTFFVIGGMGFCLLRSNGIYAFALTFLFALFFFIKKNKAIPMVMGIVLIVSFVMQKPVLKQLNVEDSELVESLSIPLQQVCRVIKEHGEELSEEDISLLSEVIPVNEVGTFYEGFISDFMKALVKRVGNEHLIKENAGEYFDLYIRLGVKYPMTYLAAWVAQTRGYFNGGYDYWVWINQVNDNDLGIYHQEKVPILNGITDKMFTMNSFRILWSIGMHVWMITGMLYLGISKKSKITIFLSIPLLGIILSLFIATPVFSEFRYAYALFTSYWFVIFAGMYNISKSIKGEK